MTKPKETEEPVQMPDPELLQLREETATLKSQIKQYTNLLRSVMTQRDKAINEAADLGAKNLELEESLQEARSIQ